MVGPGELRYLGSVSVAESLEQTGNLEGSIALVHALVSMPKHEKHAFPQHTRVFERLFEPNTPFYFALSAFGALSKLAHCFIQSSVTYRLLGGVSEAGIQFLNLLR